jgi:hypothetical protein
VGGDAGQPGLGFGLLFLGWALWDITTGESHFLQRIRRRQNPVVFWAVELSLGVQFVGT